jgi:heme/copper-type cytochrome/quinol oxidase subunit 2
VPSQQPQGQLHTEHSVDTTTIIIAMVIIIIIIIIIIIVIIIIRSLIKHMEHRFESSCVEQWFQEKFILTVN